MTFERAFLDDGDDVSRTRESGSTGGMSMSSGPKGSEESSILPCSVCGHGPALFELPGRNEKFCLQCSADVATSILLTTEIDAATLAGRETKGLVAELEQLSRSLLQRVQLA